tara:strand:- start:380 stop:568 length:189 start_codon:yes stop_codon:yes gene_type:complete
MKTRYIKYRIYKKINICYDTLMKVWVSKEMDFTALTQMELRNYISAEHRMTTLAGQCRWIEG